MKREPLWPLAALVVVIGWFALGNFVMMIRQPELTQAQRTFVCFVELVTLSRCAP